MNDNPGLNVAQLGSNIRKRRYELQLKQQDLANSTYPLSYIKAIEKGLQEPDNPFLRYVSNRLMLTISDLEGGTWPKVPRKSLKVRQEAQLLDAHLALETHQFDKVGIFLGKFKADKLHATLQPAYYAILGETQIELGNYEAARTALQKALELYKNYPETDPLHIERVRNCLGVSYGREQNFSKAVEHWKVCLNAIADSLIQDDRFRMKIYLNLSSSYSQLGEIKQAIVYYREAAIIAKRTQEDSKLAAICWGLGVCYRAEKNYPKAKINLIKGIKLYKQADDNKSVVSLNILLACVLIDNGEYIEAEKYLLEAKDISVQHGFDSFYKNVDVNMAYLYFSLQQWEKAQHYVNLAINQNRQDEDKVNLGYSLSQLGRIKLAMGENEYALKLFEEAIELLELTEAKEAIKTVYLRYAEALESMGRMQDATVFYRKVNDLVLV